MAEFVSETEALLEELHAGMFWKSAGEALESQTGPKSGVPGNRSGKSFREPIFYGPDAAYMSQYRDFAPVKYRADAQWIRRNKGFDPELGPSVVRCVETIVTENGARVAGEFQNGTPVGSWTPLAGFTFRLSDLAARVGGDEESLHALIGAFALPSGERNGEFTAMDKFNAAYAYPLIPLRDDKFVMLHPHALAEALYECPYYWMCSDAGYRDEASRNRGKFTEHFCAERLASVFGEQRVYRNVEILSPKRQRVAEIDVLVLFGNRAIIVEAKSKRLTLESRRGNDAALKQDFKYAVAEAVGQVSRSSALLLRGGADLRTNEGSPITVRGALRRVFPVTALCDDYPALSAQCREFLVQQPSDDGVARVLVTDIFQLDMMAEMLSSPLRLLSYLEHRAESGGRLYVDHERTALATHLKHNIWLRPDIDVAVVGDEVCADLDVAMAVRRDGIAGNGTPEGILTRYLGTRFERIIAEIERTDGCAAIGLGLLLLQMPEATVRRFNELVDQALARLAADGKRTT